MRKQEWIFTLALAGLGMMVANFIGFDVAFSQSLPGVLVLLVFVSVWANDSFAYLIGCKFGRHKLAPRTSPKKSWEGFLEAPAHQQGRDAMYRGRVWNVGDSIQKT